MINKWVNTNGGPLVGASENVISSWKGVDGSSSGASESDYDRACSVVDFLGVVDCGGFPVIVFGDEPLQSAFVHCNDNLVVRWVSCKSYGNLSKPIRSLVDRECVLHPLP
ncbi:Imm21 family immunity protein [Acidovorax sp. SUPP2522]|uniref:Imm21 family immunity protein n=1 Tax=unclassified Acidovorax TaxID=2684926 RepID=UPI0024E10DD8|nr:Imm21 family immunity protein [Acidovorax sp. SUPP2522]